MNVDYSLLAFLLACYLTTSFVIAYYAFKYFRKKKRESILFSLMSALLLIFCWWIPALRIAKRKLTS